MTEILRTIILCVAVSSLLVGCKQKGPAATSKKKRTAATATAPAAKKAASAKKPASKKAAAKPAASKTPETTKTVVKTPAETTPKKKDSGVPEPVWETTEKFTAMCTESLAEAKKLRAAFVKEGKIGTLAQLLVVTDRAGGWASLMFNVHPDEKLRGVAKTCQQDLSKFMDALSLDPEVYAKVAALKPEDTDGKRFVENLLKDFKHAGVDKDDKTRKRLAAIGEELTKLMQDFRTRITKDVRSVKADPKQLEGLPEDWLKARPAGKDGKVNVTTDYPDYIPVQRYAKDAKLRAALAKAFGGRGYPDNGPVLKRVLELRAEKAKLLGHPNWAAYNASDKMVKTSETIADFIAKVAKLAQPRSKKDLAELLEAKKKDDPKAKAIENWDRFYYMSKVKQAKHAYDAREARNYFPYDAVKKGIFALYAELFGLSFEPLPDAPTWDPGVEAWGMKEAGADALTGVVYLDMHPRDGKYKHAAMFSPVTGTQGGALPIGTLVCNFPDPKAKGGDGKALMEHSQVLTFLHEFGHLIHHILASGSRYVRNASINVEWDFVEAPSQLLEEWGWDAKVLQRFAKHAETGKAIPTELVAKMKAADEFGKGADVMRQIFYAGFSYHLHTRDPKKVDLEKYTDEMYAKYSPYPRIEGGHVYANFGHLMGYSSMYYTYQWSLTLAKDMFSRFKEAGLLDPKVARDYREKVLKPGGLKDAAQLVEDFLGRKSDLKAYEAWLQQ